MRISDIKKILVFFFTMFIVHSLFYAYDEAQETLIEKCISGKPESSFLSWIIGGTAGAIALLLLAVWKMKKKKKKKQIKTKKPAHRVDYQFKIRICDETDKNTMNSKEKNFDRIDEENDPYKEIQDLFNFLSLEEEAKKRLFQLHDNVVLLNEQPEEVEFRYSISIPIKDIKLVDQYGIYFNLPLCISKELTETNIELNCTLKMETTCIEKKQIMQNYTAKKHEGLVSQYKDCQEIIHLLHQQAIQNNTDLKRKEIYKIPDEFFENYTAEAEHCGKSKEYIDIYSDGEYYTCLFVTLYLRLSIQSISKIKNSAFNEIKNILNRKQMPLLETKKQRLPHLLFYDKNEALSIKIPLQADNSKDKNKVNSINTKMSGTIKLES